MIQLLILWAVFLAFQMVKSKYGHCTREYLLLFLAQTVFCISVTVFFIRAELADLGRPAPEQHGDPEMHEILLGERSGVPAGAPDAMLSLVSFKLSSSHSCLLNCLVDGTATP